MPPEPATREQLVEIALERIRSQGQISYAELGRILETHGVDPTGKHTIENRSANVVYFTGVSEEFLGVIHSPRFTNATITTSTDAASYGDDALGLAVAHKVPTRGYRQPHWAPVAFTIRSLVA